MLNGHLNGVKYDNCDMLLSKVVTYKVMSTIFRILIICSITYTTVLHAHNCIAENGSIVSAKFKNMTPSEHLKFAKQAYNQKIYAPAILHIDAIPKNVIEYNEAQNIKSEITRTNNKNINDSILVAAIDKRKRFADDLQIKSSELGITSRITAKGKSFTTLYIYVTDESDRNILFRTVNEQIRDLIGKVGFTKVIITDGGRLVHKMKI